LFFQKETEIYIADNSGAVTVKCIHSGGALINPVGKLLKTTLKRFDTEKKLVKKKKYFSLVIATVRPTNRRCGALVCFSENRALLFGDSQK